LRECMKRHPGKLKLVKRKYKVRMKSVRGR
jgi:hypothetical protein